MLTGLLQDPVHVLALGNCKAKQSVPHHAIWNICQLDDINRKERIPGNLQYTKSFLLLPLNSRKKNNLSSLSQILNIQVPKFAQERKLLINRNIFSYSSKEAEAKILLVKNYGCSRLQIREKPYLMHPSLYQALISNFFVRRQTCQLSNY